MQTPTMLPKQLRPSPDHQWDEATGEWIPPSIEVVRAKALTLIDQHHAEVIQQLVGNPTQTEKDTWALKLETANAIAAGGVPSTAGAAFLRAAGLSDPQAQATWAKTVLKKSAGYATVVGLAERLRDDAKTAVKAADTVESIEQALKDQRAKAEQAVAALLA